MLANCDPWPTLLLALVLDATLGDPPWLYRAVPHPVALMGHAVEVMERRWNDAARSWRVRMKRGAAVTLLLITGFGAIGTLLEFGLTGLSMGWILEAVVASTLIAGRGLYDHVRAVADALGLGLNEGRAAVAHIVGRDPQVLDEAGVARAAVESTAENFSDGVVAPLFWFAVLGLGGLAAYKTLNTLDSMIGHRSARFEAFGKVAARLDDAANWIPARLSGLLFVLAASLLPGADAGRAWRTMWRDAPRHRSPNAGWPEAALAGALGFALAGPRSYAGQQLEDHWMGQGRKNLDADDIRRALRLYLVAGGLLAVLLALAILV